MPVENTRIIPTSEENPMVCKDAFKSLVIAGKKSGDLKKNIDQQIQELKRRPDSFDSLKTWVKEQPKISEGGHLFSLIKKQLKKTDDNALQRAARSVRTIFRSRTHLDELDGLILKTPGSDPSF